MASPIFIVTGKPKRTAGKFRQKGHKLLKARAQKKVGSLELKKVRAAAGDSGNDGPAAWQKPLPYGRGSVTEPRPPADFWLHATEAA
jgi:hypothetical protein